MKRWISLLLLASLVLSLLCFPAAAQTDDSQGITLQCLTGPVFAQHYNGGWVPMDISGDYALFSATGRSVSVLDMFGKTINNNEIDEFTCVSPGIYYLRLLNASYGSLCRGATPFTKAIYRNVTRMGDCIVAETADGADFFGPDGSRRTVGKLPKGYSPVFVTSAGTVVARKRDDSVWSTDGRIFYRYQLFNQNGKPLLIQEYQDMYFLQDSTTLLAGLMVPTDVVFDLNGNLLNNGKSAYYRYYFHQVDASQKIKDLYSAYDHDYPIGSLYHHDIYGEDRQLLYSFDAVQTDAISESLRVVQDENFKYGLMDGSGNYIVAPAYDDYSTNGEILYDMAFAPDSTLVCLKKGSEYAVYSKDGKLVLSCDDAAYVNIYEDSILVMAHDNSSQIYDAEGAFLFTLDPGTNYVSCCGIHCIRTDKGFQIVDRSGMPLSKTVYGNITSTRAYGLANAFRDRQAFIVNAEGQEQNETSFDHSLDFEPWNVSDYGAKEALTVYEQNGKMGICRYLAPGRSQFADVGDNAWFRESVDFCTEKGVFNGTGTGRFSPSDAMTRAMTVTVLYRIAGCPEIRTRTSFTDVPETAYYADAVSWAQAEGIVNGTTATTFSPNANITREQMAAILCRYTDPELPESPEDSLKIFPDWAEHSKYAAAPLAWAVEQGLIAGTAAGDQVLLNPGGNATRAQVATILMRFIKLTAQENEE